MAASSYEPIPNSIYDRNLHINPEPLATRETNDALDNLFVPYPLNKIVEEVTSKDQIENIKGAKLKLDQNGKLLISYLESHGLIKDSIEGYNNFTLYGISRALDTIIFKLSDEKTIKFDVVKIIPPQKDGNPIYPYDARITKSTYSADVIVQHVLYDRYGEELERSEEYKFISVPVMLGSELDNLTNIEGPLETMGECSFDPMGYCIIRGAEKVIMPQIRLRSNRQLIYKDTDDDVMSIFTSRSVKGQEIFKIYEDRDNTLRCSLYGMQRGRVTDECISINGEDPLLRKNKNIRTLNALQLVCILIEGNRLVCDDLNVPSIMETYGLGEGETTNKRELLRYMLTFLTETDQIDSRQLVALKLRATLKELVANISNVFNYAYDRMYMKPNDERDAEALKKATDGRGRGGPQRPTITAQEFKENYKTFDMLILDNKIKSLEDNQSLFIFNEKKNYIDKIIKEIGEDANQNADQNSDQNIGEPILAYQGIEKDFNLDIQAIIEEVYDATKNNDLMKKDTIMDLINMLDEIGQTNEANKLTDLYTVYIDNISKLFDDIIDLARPFSQTNRLVNQYIRTYESLNDGQKYIDNLKLRIKLQMSDERIKYIRVYEHMVEHLFTHIPYEIKPEVVIASLNSKNLELNLLNFYQERMKIQNIIVKQKMDLLIFCIMRYTQVLVGVIEQDDRDLVACQYFVSPGMMMEQLFRQLFDQQYVSIANKLKNMDKKGKDPMLKLDELTDKLYRSLTDNLISAFNPNSWGPPDPTGKRPKLENITDILDRGESVISQYRHLQRLNTPSNKKGKSATIRRVKRDSAGWIDPNDTPAGGSVGLVGVRGLTCRTSIERDDQDIKLLITNYISKDPNIQTDSWIFVNSSPIGIGDILGAYKELIGKRRKWEIPFDIALILDKGVLNIYTDSGRPVRPFLVLDDDNIPIISKLGMWTAPFENLLKVGAVEYLDPYEISANKYIVAQSMTHLTFKRHDLIRNEDIMRNMRIDLVDMIGEELTESLTERITNGQEIILDGDNRIAILLRDYQNVNMVINRLRKLKYNYLEIDPTATLGIVSSIIPLMDRNPAPRNNFECGMAIQSLGKIHSNMGARFALNTKELSYSSPPLLGTQMQKILGLDDLPAGENIVIAIMTTGNINDKDKNTPTKGSNEEDAVTVKKEAFENGLFNYMLTTSKTVVLENIRSEGTTKSRYAITYPAKGFYPGHQPYQYRHLDERGIIYPNSYVYAGDCLVSIIRVDEKYENGKVIDVTYKDVSFYVKKDEGGMIETILFSETSQKELSITIKTRRHGTPISTDKVATRQAQKSTISNLVPEADLPFTAAGVTPDIILNPHALPKRMTIATLLEIIVSKYAAMAGERINGTIFRDFDLESFMDILQTVYGFKASGVETMYNPVTGEEYPCQIMIGMTYYQLLKHQGFKKAQVRGLDGPRNIKTGQAVKGKKSGGGIKMGEQEWLGLYAHGAPNFVKDRMFEASDAYNAAFCDQCNRTATIKLVNDLPSCSVCSKTNMSSCRTSRSTQVGFNIAATMGIRIDQFAGDEPESIMSRRHKVAASSSFAERGRKNLEEEADESEPDYNSGEENEEIEEHNVEENYDQVEENLIDQAAGQAEEVEENVDLEDFMY